MQYNINVANGTGMEVRTNLNLAHQSLATNFFGATDPSLMSPVCAFPGSTWADTGNGLLKVRKADDSDWIVIGTIESDGTPKLNASGISITAADVPNVPDGEIESTNVQDAINELASNAGINMRKPSTEYAVGDIAYSALLPSWAYIECTVGGTTDSGDLPVPSSVVANDTFTDGTVTWKIRKVGFDNEQELATKANRQLSNLDTANLACHVVVDSYYDSTTGDWYRVYDDGWVEQGGYRQKPSDSDVTVNLLKPMADTKYTFTTGSTFTSSNITYNNILKNPLSTTKLVITSGNHGPSYYFYFRVEGMGASV